MKEGFEIKVSINKEGQFTVDVPEGTPIFMAIGALEVGKKVLIEGDNSEEGQEKEGE